MLPSFNLLGIALAKPTPTPPVLATVTVTAVSFLLDDTDDLDSI